MHFKFILQGNTSSRCIKLILQADTASCWCFKVISQADTSSWYFNLIFQTWTSCFYARTCQHCFPLHSGDFQRSQGRAIARLKAVSQFVRHSTSEHHHVGKESVSIWDLFEPMPPRWGRSGHSSWCPDHSHSLLYLCALPSSCPWQR